MFPHNFSFVLQAAVTVVLGTLKPVLEIAKGSVGEELYDMLLGGHFSENLISQLVTESRQNIDKVLKEIRPEYLGEVEWNNFDRILKYVSVVLTGPSGNPILSRETGEVQMEPNPDYGGIKAMVLFSNFELFYF